jgi:hypothetical protein
MFRRQLATLLLASTALSACGQQQHMEDRWIWSTPLRLEAGNGRTTNLSIRVDNDTRLAAFKGIAVVWDGKVVRRERFSEAGSAPKQYAAQLRAGDGRHSLCVAIWYQGVDVAEPYQVLVQTSRDVVVPADQSVGLTIRMVPRADADFSEMIEDEWRGGTESQRSSPGGCVDGLKPPAPG